MPTKFSRASWFQAVSLGVLAACSGTSGTEVSVDQQLTIDECTSVRDARAAEAGRVAGASLVQSAWTNFNNCADFATFEQIILDDVALLVCQGSSYTQCRCLGMKKGMEETLAGLKTACECTENQPDAVEAGRMTGLSLVQAAWNGFNNCADFATFEQTVRDAASVECKGSAYTECRCFGLKNGVEEKLAELKAACGVP